MSREESKTLTHELWEKKLRHIKAHCTSDCVHAERSLCKVMFNKDFEPLWCGARWLLSNSRAPECNSATAHHRGTIWTAITNHSEKFLRGEGF